MKTKRTDMTEEEIKRAEDLGICTLTPDEIQDDAWQRTSVGKHVSLDTAGLLIMALLVFVAVRPLFRKKEAQAS